MSRGRKPELHRINERILARQVRVVGDNITQGVFSIEEALKIAQSKQLDLVEIAPNVVPPVCKVIDYNKFLYEHKKKQKLMKSKSTRVVVKELRFGPNTDAHDFNFKLRHAIKFLREGAKVKAFVFFKGRSITYKEQGEEILLRLAQELLEHAIVEKLPVLEGKRMFMILIPKKHK